MEEWADYVLEMTSGHGDSVCIVKLGEETTQWIATSHRFHVTNTDFYQQVLSQKLFVPEFGLNQEMYAVDDNDGTFMTATSHSGAALCVARAKDFFIFARCGLGYPDECKQEVTQVYEYLINA